jgi:hypothetical protein
MRVTIKAPTLHIEALMRYAASHFSVAGNVVATFRETRTPKKYRLNPENPKGPLLEEPDVVRQPLWGGYCSWNNKKVSVRATLNPNHPQLPYKTATLGYFRGSTAVTAHSSGIPIKPYELHTPNEIIVHVAAHEFAHVMPAGSKFRKSRIEVFCENRATEVLEAFRTPEGQQWIENWKAQQVKPEAPKLAPEEKLAAELVSVEAKLKRWTTKAKRAATAIKKLERRKKHLLKKQSI